MKKITFVLLCLLLSLSSYAEVKVLEPGESVELGSTKYICASKGAVEKSKYSCGPCVRNTKYVGYQVYDENGGKVEIRVVAKCDGPLACYFRMEKLQECKSYRANDEDCN